MVRHIDIHAMDIVLYARAAPIFHGVHGTVYHDLRAEGIMAGHSDHTDRCLFAAGGKPLRIAAAALCTGAVMRHLYLQRIKRLAGWGVYHRRIVIHDAEAAIGKPSFIAWRIQDNADAAGGMHPHTCPFRIISGKNKHMAPAVIIRKESQITRQQLRCGDAVGIRVLSVAAGADLNAYIAAGVYSDHECHDVKDAIAKLERGQFIMIREGTAARNLEALAPLLCEKYIERCMFCTDDKHPNDLLEKGHIDYIVKKAISLGADPIMAVKAAGYTAARYFLLNNRGAIAPGYLADFVVIDNWENFEIEMVYKKGKLMYDGVLRDFDTPEIDPYLVKRAHDTFHVAPLSAADFTDKRPHAVIGMVPGEIVSEDAGYADHIDLEQDILKIAVIERHKNTHHIGLGYIKGYGLRHGAVATSISHDSHNIIVVGTSEEDMAAAANRIVENRGGITVMDGGQILGEVALPIAGIMSDDSLVMVNSALEAAKDEAFRLGVSRGIDPFMTLSFMALPVIPSLRLTTRGVFDVLTQRYV